MRDIEKKLICDGKVAGVVESLLLAWEKSGKKRAIWSACNAYRLRAGEVLGCAVPQVEGIGVLLVVQFFARLGMRQQLTPAQRADLIALDESWLAEIEELILA